MKKYKLNTNKKWKKDKLKINRSVKSSLTVCLVPHFSPFLRFLPPIILLLPYIPYSTLRRNGMESINEFLISKKKKEKKTCKLLSSTILSGGVFGVIMIFQLVSPIKLFPAQSATMLGQLAAFEPLMPSKVRHPRVPLPTLPAHILLPFARAKRD